MAKGTAITLRDVESATAPVIAVLDGFMRRVMPAAPIHAEAGARICEEAPDLRPRYVPSGSFEMRDRWTNASAW